MNTHREMRGERREQARICEAPAGPRARLRAAAVSRPGEPPGGPLPQQRPGLGSGPAGEPPLAPRGHGCPALSSQSARLPPALLGRRAFRAITTGGRVLAAPFPPARRKQEPQGPRHLRVRGRHAWPGALGSHPAETLAPHEGDPRWAAPSKVGGEGPPPQGPRGGRPATDGCWSLEASALLGPSLPSSPFGMGAPLARPRCIWRHVTHLVSQVHSWRGRCLKTLMPGCLRVPSTSLPVPRPRFSTGSAPAPVPALSPWVMPFVPSPSSRHSGSLISLWLLRPHVVRK